MKNTAVKYMISTALVLSIFPLVPIHAEDYSDSDYWNQKCQSANIQTQDDFQACKAYTEYIAQNTPDLQAQLDAINAQKADIEANISAYQDQLTEYQNNVETLNGTISDLEAQRGTLQAQIADTQAQIESKQQSLADAQTVIDSMSAKVKERMVNAQATLRVNNLIDVLMGAKTFSDFMRVASGLASIADKEKSENDELVQAMRELSSAKQVLQDSQDQLSQQEGELQQQEVIISNQREQVLVDQYKVQVIETAAQSQEAILQAQGNHVATNIAEVQSQMSSISDSLDALENQLMNPTPAPTIVPIPTSEPSSGDSASGDSSSTDQPASTPTSTPDSQPVTTGWARPVYGSYRSAGTWEYPGGGIHLGYDFAVSSGTPLYAAGTGVIMLSVSGCPVGKLGSRCGEDAGGYGGGNQLYLLCVVDGSLYGLIYCHMTDGTLVPQGTIVKAGDYLGLSGSSGNSSGPHCHIEVMYLGDGSNFANYARTWDGDLAYGAGWAGSYDGYGRRCEAGYGAPCRIRPETIWGY